MTRRRRRIYLHDLLGRRVRAEGGQVVGRIEEVCAERRGDEHEVTEYHIGTGALLERLAVTRWMFGRGDTLVARWDQIDIDRPARPTLTCPPGELKKKT
jgi:hypothetical protein